MQSNGKRWLCKYGNTEMEIYARDKNEVIATLRYYGFTSLAKVSIDEICKPKLEPIQ